MPDIIMAKKFQTIRCGDDVKTSLCSQILNDAGILNHYIYTCGEGPYPYIQVFEKDATKALEILKLSGLFKGSNEWPIIE